MLRILLPKLDNMQKRQRPSDVGTSKMAFIVCAASIQWTPWIRDSLVTGQETLHSKIAPHAATLLAV